MMKRLLGALLFALLSAFPAPASWEFDGANDQVELGAYTNDAAYSVFAWISPDTVGAFMAVFDHAASGDNSRRRFELRLKNTSPALLQVFMDRATTFGRWECATPTIAADKWTSVGVTMASMAVSTDPVMYINGVSCTPTEDSTPVGAAEADGGNVFVGEDGSGGLDFDGWKANLAEWSRALSSTEMATVHAYGPFAVANGLSIYWPMDEATSTARDKSGNGRNGVLTGTTNAPGEAPPLRLRPAFWPVR